MGAREEIQGAGVKKELLDGLQGTLKMRLG